MRSHLFQLAVLCVALCGPDRSFSQDYFPLAAGHAWNYLAESPESGTWYTTTFILKDSVSTEGYPLYALALRPDSLSLSIFDSTYSFRDGYYEKGDTVFPCKGADLTVRRSRPAITHALYDNQIITSSMDYLITDPVSNELVTVTDYDTVFISYIGSYSIGSNSFPNCFRSKRYSKTYGTTQQWVISDTTFCIYAPDIGIIKGWNKEVTETLRGYRRGNSTTWLAGISIRSVPRQFFAATHSVDNAGRMYTVLGQRIWASKFPKSMCVLVGREGIRLK